MLCFGALRVDLCLSIVAGLQASVVVRPPEEAYPRSGALNAYPALGISNATAGVNDAYDLLESSFELFIVSFAVDVAQRILSIYCLWAERKQLLRFLRVAALWWVFLLAYISVRLIIQESCGHTTLIEVDAWKWQDSVLTNRVRPHPGPRDGTLFLSCAEPRCGKPTSRGALLRSLNNDSEVADPLVFDPRYSRLWVAPTEAIIVLFLIVRLVAHALVISNIGSFGHGLKRFAVKSATQRAFDSLPPAIRGDRNIEKCVEAMLRGTNVVRIVETKLHSLGSIHATDTLPQNHRTSRLRAQSSKLESEHRGSLEKGADVLHTAAGALQDVGHVGSIKPNALYEGWTNCLRCLGQQLERAIAWLCLGSALRPRRAASESRR